MTSFTLAAVTIDLLITFVMMTRLGAKIEQASNSSFILFPVMLTIIALCYSETSEPLTAFARGNQSYLVSVRLAGSFLKLFLSCYVDLYCLQLIGKSEDRWRRRWMPVILLVPMAIALVLAVLTPKYGLLLTFDADSRCVLGPCDIVYYIIAIYYYAVSILLLIDQRRSISRQIRRTCVLLILFSAIGMLVQSRLGLVNFDVFVHSLCCLIMLYEIMDNREMVAALSRKNEEITELMRQTIAALTTAIEVNDEYTEGHSQRVADIGVLLGRRLNMDEADIQKLYYTGLIHDIGKIGIDRSVLNKPGHLDPAEYKEVQRHSVIGANIAAKITAMPEMQEVTRHHHERYDGHGYPDGLKGEQIPLFARIIGIADAFDAMTSDRVYRDRLTLADVRRELVEQSGRQFDPRLAALMVGLLDEGIIPLVKEEEKERPE